MKKLTLSRSQHAPGNTRFQQQGFIPLMISILVVVAVIIYLVYMRVASVSN